MQCVQLEQGIAFARQDVGGNLEFVRPGVEAGDPVVISRQRRGQAGEGKKGEDFAHGYSFGTRKNRAMIAHLDLHLRSR